MSAARSVQVVLANLTPETLILASSNLSHGIWSAGMAPPQNIPPFASATWQLESNGFLTGAEGSSTYAFEGDSSQVVTLSWNDPYAGGDTFSASAPSDFLVTTNSADGDNATVTHTLMINNFPSGWMQANLESLGSRPLRHLCIPGSHDSGTSVITSGTAFGTANNTQTQTLDILGQLQCGVRYFDVRPVISQGQYFTGHYTGPIDLPVIGPSMQGTNGQSIASIISDVNTYTAEHQELVVLYLSHDFETDLGNASYPPFSQADWNGLLTQLLALNHRFVAPNPTTVDLTQLTLNDFIGSQAAVIVVVDPSASGITLGDFATQGFYTPANFSVYNQYSDTNVLSVMETDQLNKLAAQRPNPDAGYFLLSWTLTQNNVQAALPTSESILSLAATANRALYGALLPACSAQTYPNILYIDAVSSSDIAALAMAVNNKASAG
ncbi:MAG: hypothetical protein HC897_14535 [Thermoanaerobaculia bacterium]|nr:hypothetical protein [Thermoanaerobaculia bacterium]